MEAGIISPFEFTARNFANDGCRGARDKPGRSRIGIKRGREIAFRGIVFLAGAKLNRDTSRVPCEDSVFSAFSSGLSREETQAERKKRQRDEGKNGAAVDAGWPDRRSGLSILRECPRRD